MLNSFKLSPQYIPPKLWLTRLADWGASKRAGWLTRLVIDLFARYCKIDIREAQKPDTASYHTFNDFFIHPLRDDARPINTDPNVLVVPADSVINQLGNIEENKLLQAKGHSYTLEALLAGNYQMADKFRNDTFVTTYLSPHDYHRVHALCSGILREVMYVPGDLFFVNILTVQDIPNLFARNERVICLLDAKFGLMVQTLVSATAVGSIGTTWTDTITPPREDVIKRWTQPEDENERSVALLKGQKMGYFKLGSIVINLFAPGKVNLVEQLQDLSVTKIGQPMAISTETFMTPEAEPAPLTEGEIKVEHNVSPLVDDKRDGSQTQESLLCA